VSNYALRQKSPEEVKGLEKVKAVREMELAESKVQCQRLLNTSIHTYMHVLCYGESDMPECY
jgi:hypothetical protein